MNITPFNILYNGFDLTMFTELKGMEKLYDKYFQLVKTDAKKINLPAYIYDVGSDNFGIKNAFGKELNSINGYFFNDKLINSNISFPAKKTDYPDLYGIKGVVFIRIDEKFKWIPIFNDYFSYSIFNKKFKNRYEYFLNIFYSALFSKIDGTVKAIDSTSITITSSNNKDNKYNRKNGILSVSINDKVTTGELIEKQVSVEFIDGEYVITTAPNITKKIPDYLLPLKGIFTLK